LLILSAFCFATTFTTAHSSWRPAYKSKIFSQRQQNEAIWTKSTVTCSFCSYIFERHQQDVFNLKMTETSWKGIV
jgi:hypothetical protein